MPEKVRACRAASVFRVQCAGAIRRKEVIELTNHSKERNAIVNCH